MTATNSSAGSFTRVRRRLSPLYWVWAIVVAAILITGSTFWLTARQRQLATQLSAELILVRQSRIDLIKGYLHVTMAGSPLSPFDRNLGQALLDQAQTSLEQVRQLQQRLGVGGAGAADDISRNTLSDFIKDSRGFRDILDRWPGTPGSDPALEAELRIAFYSLEQHAGLVDSLIQRDLALLNARYDRLYGWVLAGTAIMLAIIGGAVYLGSRAQRKAEEATQALLKQVQSDKDMQDRLLNNMTDEVWFADTNGHFTLANPAACKAFALESAGDTDIQEFALGLEVFRPDGSPRPPGEAPPLRALAGETVIDMEEIVRLPRSGDLRYRLVNSSPVKDSGGRIIGCVSVVRDITDRKDLQREVAHMASFPAQNPNPVLEIGIDGTVRFANAAATATLARLGLDSDARQFLPGEPEELVLLRSQCARKPQTREIRLGDATFLRVLDAPDEDTLRVYVTDITERKRAEEEVHALNADLDLRVRRRTMELSAANKELEAFSYSVSHDLRAPLRSIDGFSLAFLEDYGSLVPEEGRDYLERVRRGTQHMGQLIDDMLLLSQVTRSRMNTCEIDISALAAEVAGELARENPQRDLQMRIEPGMTARGDPDLLRIVLVNLLGNAWKFTSKRDHAHVSMGTVHDPVRGYAFFVRDDGVGFEPKYTDKLFVAFQRLHSIQDFPGTGIGLATIQRIVRRYGGEVWAEGEVDRGATFYFTIPDLHEVISEKEQQP